MMQKQSDGATKPTGRSWRRYGLFALLYFCEGCPIGFIWWALPAWLRTLGIEVDRITQLTSLVLLPWVLKFLWAPLVDSCRTPRWGFKHWILGAQLLMALSLLPLSWLSPEGHWRVWIAILAFHGFAAATQDVAIDGLAIRWIDESERGRINGWMQAGMLTGRSLFGGGAILMLSSWGMETVLAGLIACIAATSLVVWRLEEPAFDGDRPAGLQSSWKRLAGAVAARDVRMALGVALVCGAGFECVGAVVSPFLIDRGMPVESIGRFFGGPVVLAMAAGALIGGFWTDRLGPRKTLPLFLYMLTAGILALVLWDGWRSRISIPTLWPYWILLAGIYVGIGLFIAASYAWFMGRTSPAFAATQFSLFMAATNGCESWAGWVGGAFAARAGYPVAFVALTLLSLGGLVFFRWGRVDCLPRPRSSGNQD